MTVRIILDFNLDKTTEEILHRTHFLVIAIIVISCFGLLFGAGETFKIQWMGIGARTLAMGNTGTAIIGLPYASFYNPASVSARGKFSVAGGNQFLALDRKLYFASLASEISGGAGVGFTWVHSSISDVEARDIDGELVGTVNNGDDAIFFSFAKEFVTKMHIGAGIEYVQRSLENITTSTAGFGIGVSYRIENPNITLGFAAQNLLMTLSWNSNEYYGTGQVSNEKLPILLRAGSAYLTDIKSIPVQFCADMWNGGDSQIHYGIGAEVGLFSGNHYKKDNGIENSGGNNKYIPQLILRGGFTDGRLSGGVGICSRIGKAVNIGIDYAIVMEKENLSPKHIVDLTFEY